MQARYTRYESPPDPPDLCQNSPLLHREGRQAVFDYVWRIHCAEIQPRPSTIKDGVFKLGLIYLPHDADADYISLQQLWWKFHLPTIETIQRLARPDCYTNSTSVGALMSLATDLGPSGFAASEVVWWLVRTYTPSHMMLRRSWRRYCAPFGSVDAEWAERRSVEVEDFLRSQASYLCAIGS